MTPTASAFALEGNITFAQSSTVQDAIHEPTHAYLWRFGVDAELGSAVMSDIAKVGRVQIQSLDEVTHTTDSESREGHLRFGERFAGCIRVDGCVLFAMLDGQPADVEVLGSEVVSYLVEDYLAARAEGGGSVPPVGVYASVRILEQERTMFLEFEASAETLTAFEQAMHLDPE